MTHYSVLIGSSGGGEPATSYTTYSAGQSATVTVPSGYNAMHFQFAVGGGGGGTGGIDYDRAGGESSGASGGAGAYISDVIFEVTAGTAIQLFTGTGGAPGNQTANFKHPRTASAGTNTYTFGPELFVLRAGGGGSLINGSVQGPLAQGIGGGSGSAQITGTRITSGYFFNSSNQLITIGNVAELQGGPVGTFNQSGIGIGGSWNGNCSGDNCRIGGAAGANSYGGAINGGSASSSAGAGTAGGNGSRGSGGGAGAAQVNAGSTNGGSGGNGEMKFRFLDVFGQ